jgi:hypothetical protein
MGQRPTAANAAGTAGRAGGGSGRFLSPGATMPKQTLILLAAIALAVLLVVIYGCDVPYYEGPPIETTAIVEHHYAPGATHVTTDSAGHMTISKDSDEYWIILDTSQGRVRVDAEPLQSQLRATTRHGARIDVVLHKRLAQADGHFMGWSFCGIGATPSGNGEKP